MNPKPLLGHEGFKFSLGSAHAENVLRTFKHFRDNHILTDVIICVEGEKFPCHRAVLAAFSNYFRAMFSNGYKESREMLVKIKGILAEAMDCFLQYVYTGKVTITTENVQYLIETASLFQVNSLCDECAHFLEEQLDPCNCLGIQRFADTHSLKTLFERCHAFALQTFEHVYQHEEFLELDKDGLINYISNDDLIVRKEEIVFEAVMRWIYEDVDHRRLFLPDLLYHIRLPLLHPNYFVETVEEDQLIRNSPECHHLLQEARRYQVLGNEIVSPRTRPRRSTGYSEVIILVGGCEQVGGFHLPYTECYDPVTGEWISLAKIPDFTKSAYAVSKKYITAVSLKNLIYVAGGMTTTVDCYNPVEDYWMHIQDTRSPRENCGMTVCNGKIYILGGRQPNGEAINTVLCYDVETNIISEVARMPNTLSYHGCMTIHRYNERHEKHSKL
ncbi:Kelch-like protein 24 [Lemmus lemmus]